jgi:hypothetical protein
MTKLGVVCSQILLPFSHDVILTLLGGLLCCLWDGPFSPCCFVMVTNFVIEPICCRAVGRVLCSAILLIPTVVRLLVVGNPNPTSSLCSHGADEP